MPRMLSSEKSGFFSQGPDPHLPTRCLSHPSAGPSGPQVPAIPTISARPRSPRCGDFFRFKPRFSQKRLGRPRTPPPGPPRSPTRGDLARRRLLAYPLPARLCQHFRAARLPQAGPRRKCPTGPRILDNSGGLARITVDTRRAFAAGPRGMSPFALPVGSVRRIGGVSARRPRTSRRPRSAVRRA